MPSPTTPDSLRDEHDVPPRTLAELISLIYDEYHVPLRQELRQLEHLAENVALRGVALGKELHLTAVELAEDLRLHMLREENDIFPRILSGQAERCRTVIEALHVDNHETRGRGAVLRELVSACAPDLPEDLVRELNRIVDTLDRHLKEHRYFEEDLLFTRALAGEPPYGDEL